VEAVVLALEAIVVAEVTAALVEHIQVQAGLLAALEVIQVLETEAVVVVVRLVILEQVVLALQIPQVDQADLVVEVAEAVAVLQDQLAQVMVTAAVAV
jgi:hypothetical protein